MNASLSVDPKRRDKVNTRARFVKERMVLASGRVVDEVEIWNDSDTVILKTSGKEDLHFKRDDEVLIFD